MGIFDDVDDLDFSEKKQDEPGRPIEVIKSIMKGSDPGLFEFHLATYSKTTNYADYKKTIFPVNGSEIESLVPKALGDLKPGEEMALHSSVYVGGYPKHIPMIDFFSPNFQQCVLGLVWAFGSIEDYAFYHSGNSYHAYRKTLLSEEEWHKFMGKLILINKTSQIVDTRWIGHRLVQGCGALRWSCNSGKHVKVPSFVPLTPEMTHTG